MTAQLHDLPWDAIAACPTPLATAFDALDARLAAAAQRVRVRDQCTLDELRGIAVGHARVESLLADGRRVHAGGALADAHGPPMADDLLLHPAWRALARWCAPGVVERELVLLALARELFSHYEPVFGYLNDDLTRRWPTRALALQLLARDGHEAALLADATAASSPLVQGGVLRLLDETPAHAASAVGIGVTPLATALLGDAHEPWRHLPPSVRVEPDPRSRLG